MLFPTSIVFNARYNKRAVGSYVHYVFGSSQETITVNVSTLTAILKEVPASSPAAPQVNRAIGGGGQVYTETAGIPGPLEYNLDYTTGVLTFHPDVLLAPPTGSNGTLYVDYYGTGSIVWAEDVTNVQDACTHFKNYYFDRQGTYPMTGDMDLGANDIINTKSLTISQSAAALALSVTQQTNNDAVDITKSISGAGKLLVVNNSGSGDSIEVNAGSSGVGININTTDTGNGLDITSTSYGTALNIVQNGDAPSVYIGHAGTTYDAVTLVNTGQEQAVDISNSSGSKSAIYVNNDSVYPALWAVQDGAGGAILIDQNGAGSAISVTQAGAATAVVLAQNDTTYGALSITSAGNSYAAVDVAVSGDGQGISIDANGQGRALLITHAYTNDSVYIHKENAGTGSGISILNDGTDPAITLDNSLSGGGVKVIGSSVGTDFSVLPSTLSTVSEKVSFRTEILNTSTGDLVGLETNLTTSGDAFAFSFLGDEKAVTGSGNSITVDTGVGTLVINGWIKIRVATTTYYMPFGTLS